MRHTATETVALGSIVVLLLVFVPSMGVAAVPGASSQEPVLGKGAVEIQGDGSLRVISPAEDESFTMVDASASVGSYVDSTTLLGVGFSYSRSTYSTRYGDGYVYATWHFPSAEFGNTVPFLGAMMGSTYGYGDDVMRYTVRGGVKVFFTARSAFVFQPYYRFYEGTGKNRGSIAGVSVGIVTLYR